jgi:hypothetical protein
MKSNKIESVSTITEEIEVVYTKFIWVAAEAFIISVNMQ